MGQQAERSVERARVQVREGGCQRPVGAPPRLGGQRDRPLEEGRRGRQPGAGLGLDRRLLERGGHLFVGPGGRGSQVPHPPLRIGLGVRRRGQRQVGDAAILRGPGRVGSRPHQGVPEPHLGADLQQLFRIGRSRRVMSQAQRRGGPPQQRGIPGGVGRSQQHQPLGRLRQRPHPLHVVVLETTRQTRRGRTGKATRQLGLVQSSRQLQQPQRVSPRLGHDPVANPVVQMTWDRGGQQRPRVLVSDPFDRQRRQTRKHLLTGRLPDREQEQHRLRQQPPGDEPEHLARGVVQPLSVIDQADQRPRGGVLGQQAQSGQTHHEPVGGRPRRQPEGHPQRVLLRLRQRGQAVQHRHAELMQRRERQLHLRLDAGELNQAAPCGLARAVADQRSLADPRLTPDDQHRTLTATNAVQQGIEDLAFASTSPEGRRPRYGHAVTIRPVIGHGNTLVRRGCAAVQTRAMDIPLDGSPAGRVAIVTGGSRGAGRATIRVLAARGYAVVVNYLHDRRAAESAVEAILGR